MKSLAIHALTLIVATFIGLVIIGNGEASGFLSFLFWGVVIMSYAAYFMLLLGAILEKDRAVRVGLCIVLAVWFILTLFDFSEWAMHWSV